MAAHQEVFSHRILFVTSSHATSSKIKIEFGRTSLGGNDVAVVEERKVADFIDRHK